MKKAFRRFTTILRNLFWFITKVFFSGVIVDSFCFFISLPRCQTAHAQLGNYLHYLLLTFNTIFVAQPEMPQNFLCTPCEKFSHKNLTNWINCVQNSTTYRAQKPLNVGYKNSSGWQRQGCWADDATPQSRPQVGGQAQTPYHMPSNPSESCLKTVQQWRNKSKVEMLRVW